MSAAQFGTLVCIGKRILTIAAYFQQIEFQAISPDFSRSIEAKCVELVRRGFLPMLCQSQLIWISEESRQTNDLKYLDLFSKFRSNAVAILKPYRNRYWRLNARRVLLEMLKQHLKSMRRLLKKWNWSHSRCHTTSRLCCAVRFCESQKHDVLNCDDDAMRFSFVRWISLYSPHIWAICRNRNIDE